MDLRKLKTLIELVETSGIAELEIQEGEERVRITRVAWRGYAASSAAAPTGRWRLLAPHAAAGAAQRRLPSATSPRPPRATS